MTPANMMVCARVSVLLDYDRKKAENARRMADVEARIQKFKDEHA